jgi:Xaa-Pro aminopeptidase
MRYQSIDNRLFIANRKKLAQLMPAMSMAIVLSNDEMPRNGDQCFPYRQNSDMFYLTGIEQEKSVLFLFPGHPVESQREILFILKPEEHLETWLGRKLRKKEAAYISGIKTVRFLDDFEQQLKDMLLSAKVLLLNQNEYPKFFNPNESAELRFARRIKQDFPAMPIDRLAPMLWKIRMAKDPLEIGLLDKACRITNQAFKRVLGNLQAGMFEYEVEALITYEFVKNGATHAYNPIVASGINACSLHYTLNSDICYDGDLLLMDFGAEYANYAADCTRTIPINGRFDARQREVYEAVLRIQRHAFSLLKPGNTIAKVNAETNLLAEEEMIKLGLFTKSDVKSQDPDNPLYFKYMMHGVNHYTGLDVHDVGGKDEPFLPGMVLTFEPAIYIREECIGIRLENNIVIGYPSIDLMANIPIEPDEIEDLMAHKGRLGL